MPMNMPSDGSSIGSTENSDVYSNNNRLNESNNDLMPSPFEDDEGVSPSQTSTQDVKQFYFVLEEDAGPWYQRGDRLTSQFTPNSFQREQAATLSSGGGFSMPHPILQWISGGQETISMQVRLFSAHSEDRTAEQKYTMLKDLAQPIPEFGRPPIVSFFWGQLFPDGFPCTIEGYGSEQFDEIRPDGSMRGVTLQLTLKRWQPFYLEQESGTPQERTPSRIAKDGETYELIAQQEYGDPLYGVLLRRMNPRKNFDLAAPRLIADLEDGDRVKIYPKRDMQSAGRITPECHILKATSNAAQARSIIFQTRGEKVGYLPRR